MTILAFLALWFLASIPFGIMMGRFCARRDLAHYVIAPSDRGDR